MTLKDLSFSAKVEAWAEQTKRDMQNVFIEATFDAAEEMTRVGPSVAATNAAIAKGMGGEGRGKKRKLVQGPPKAPGRGGRMPVDTGYLRSSLVGSTSGPMPMREDSKPQKDQTYTPTGQVEMVINGLKIGQTIWMTFTAIYARKLEYRYGFVRLTAQRWQQIVNGAVARVKAARK